MIEFYANEVYCGRMTMNDIPSEYKEDVEKQIEVIKNYPTNDPVSEPEEEVGNYDVRISDIEDYLSVLTDIIIGGAKND